MFSIYVKLIDISLFHWYLYKLVRINVSWGVWCNAWFHVWMSPTDCSNKVYHRKLSPPKTNQGQCMIYYSVYSFIGIDVCAGFILRIAAIMLFVVLPVMCREVIKYSDVVLLSSEWKEAWVIGQSLTVMYVVWFEWLLFEWLLFEWLLYKWLLFFVVAVFHGCCLSGCCFSHYL